MPSTRLGESPGVDDKEVRLRRCVRGLRWKLWETPALVRWQLYYNPYRWAKSSSLAQPVARAYPQVIFWSFSQSLHEYGLRTGLWGLRKEEMSDVFLQIDSPHQICHLLTKRCFTRPCRSVQGARLDANPARVSHHPKIPA